MKSWIAPRPLSQDRQGGMCMVASARSSDTKASRSRLSKAAA
jgi:hypothetical protein